MTDTNDVALYDYSLPPELIAKVPAQRRDQSRLLVVDRGARSIEHAQFCDLPQYLNPHDLLVMNNTRVVPARLQGFRTETGGKWEGLFLREEAPDETEQTYWRIIGSTRGKLQAGETITLTHGEEELVLDLIERQESEWIASPQSDTTTLDLLESFGTMPLPPYMEREAEADDFQRYQTVYADRPGAVAAPTAGLHFTDELFAELTRKGIDRSYVTLHVGIGTFRPISSERLSDHEMHHEWCELPAATADKIEQCRKDGGRTVAVGTTSVRTLESLNESGQPVVGSRSTNLFITPGFDFQLVDVMITNFHLPKSTLLVLVSAFADQELILEAYQEAIRERYRFYSYGDAMLIL